MGREGNHVSDFPLSLLLWSRWIADKQGQDEELRQGPDRLSPYSREYGLNPNRITRHPTIDWHAYP
jgi:hypothetical protein